jgi:Tol biopolymer transport system component
MDLFEQLQARHEELLSQQDSGAELVDSVRDYIAQVRQAGSQVVSPQERDQLRANLRYWSGYVYEHTGTYPNTELAPAAYASAKVGMVGRALPWYGWLLVGIVALLFILAMLILFLPANVGPVELPTAPAVELNGSPTATPSPAFTPTPTDTPTPTMTATATVTGTPTREGLPVIPPPAVDTVGIAVELTSLQDGEEVRPITAVSGSYRNLRDGWSIHVLLQPISEGGRLFPAEQFATIPAAEVAGEWRIEVAFGEGTALERPEQYNIQLAVAIDDGGREVLQNALEFGFDEIPGQLLLFPQITTVRRGAYYAINETRLVYAELFPRQQHFDLVTTRPDGSDRRQLTFTPNVSEFDPHISPSGRQIVYVRREAQADTLSSSIWVMSSSGQNQTQLLAEPDTVYERPVWSPDGRFIAYSASVEQRFSQIFLYDTLTGDVTQLTASPHNSRFPSWLPDGQALIYNSFTPVPGLSDVSTQALFRLDLESQETSLLFDDPNTIETHPAVSPDGSLVAYTSVRTVGERLVREIYLLDLATLTVRQLTANGDDQFPRWHPDGETIYFDSFRSTIGAVDINGVLQDQLAAAEGLTSITPDSGFLEAFLPIE